MTEPKRWSTMGGLAITAVNEVQPGCECAAQLAGTGKTVCPVCEPYAPYVSRADRG